MASHHSFTDYDEDSSSSNEQLVPDYGSVPTIEPTKTTFKNEFMIIGKSAIPLMFTMFLQYSINAVSILSVGHIGENELAGVSLANVTFVVTSSIFIGMATCLDTLCPQAYGAKKYHLVGTYLQRCVTLCFIISIPVIIVFYFSGSILKHVVPNEELAYLAQSYLRIVSIGLPGYILFECGKRFLQAQGNFFGGQYTLFFCAPLNAIMNYLFVFKFGMGYCGAPIAVALNFWIMAILLFSYCVLIDGNQCWYGFQWRQCFKGWKAMIDLALPGILMIEAEFLAFQIITLSCSRFGTTALAAQSVVSSMASLSFQIPFSISIAASTRIGSLIGSNSKEASKISVNVTLFYSLFSGLWNFSILLVFRSQIAGIFTSDPIVISKAVYVFPIVALNQFYDCFNVLAAGCLRAQGRQKIGGYLNLAAYYLIGLPLAMLLGFKYGYEIRGLWGGLGVGIFVLALLEIFYIYTSDWDRIIETSIQRHKQAESDKIIDEHTTLV